MEDQAASLSSKSRRLTMEETPTSRKTTCSGTLGPFLGAKSLTEREATKGQYLGAVNWTKLGGIKEKAGGKLPGEFDLKTENI